MDSNQKNEENFAKEMEQAIRRIKAQEKMGFSRTLTHINELRNLALDLRAKKIYGAKEAEAFQSKKTSVDLPPPVQRAEITAEILELNSSYLCHKLIQNTTQNAAINVQIQDVVHQRIHQIDEDADPESTPRLRNILNSYGNNISVSKSLVKVIEKKEELDVEVLQSRLKALTMMKKIRQKWQSLKDKEVHDEGDEDIKIWKNKLEARSQKITIMAHMLQGLISSSGVAWATKKYYLEIMLLCDCLLLKGQLDGSFKEVENHIERARMEKDNANMDFEIEEESENKELGPRTETDKVVEYITNINVAQPLPY